MNTGLKENYKEEIVNKLNVYLSDIQVSYMNVRGYHWNIVGQQFFSLHEKFEEVYNNLNDMADEIAERILMLGGSPLHAFSEYLKVATLKERQHLSSTEDTLSALLEDLSSLVAAERELLNFASENNDEATVGMLSGYISDQEKAIWMFNSLIK